MLRRYLSLLVSLQGNRAALALGCMFLSSMLNGVGVLILVPLLQLVGVRGGVTGIAAWVRALLDEMGLSASLGSMLIVYLVVIISHALLTRWLNLLNTDLERSFTKTLEKRLYAAIMRTDWLFFLRHRNSDLTFALTNNVYQVSAGTMHLLRLGSTAILTVVHVVLCVAISPLISLVILGCFLAFWVMLARYDRTVQRTGKELVKLNQELYGNVTDYLAGMKEAKSVGSEQRQIESFDATSDAIKETYLNYSRTRENTAMAYKLGSAVVLSIVLYAAIEILRFPMFELMLLIVITARLLPRLRGVQSDYQQVLHMLPAFDSLMSLLRCCEAARESQPNLTQEPLQLTREIRVEGVSFQYREEGDAWAVRDIDLVIPIGSTLAIVGGSGAGKTTLADLLMGLLQPTHGQICIDEHPLSGQTASAWRQSIGYVPQETFLLHDSLRANLLWVQPEATDSELWSALRLAAAVDFVTSLPKGLDSIVGDRGVRLSGGERQRIALARALLRKPKFLILDEATSSLDAENQQRIQDAVQQLHREITVVIIAHRLSAVQIAEQIVVLEAGRLVENGSYRELATRTDGRFREMLEADLAGPAATVS